MYERKIFENRIEMSRLFPSHHGGAVQMGEGTRELAETRRQRMSFEHAASNPHHHRADVGLFGLLRNGAQRFFDR